MQTLTRLLTTPGTLADDLGCLFALACLAGFGAALMVLA